MLRLKPLVKLVSIAIFYALIVALFAGILIVSPLDTEFLVTTESLQWIVNSITDPGFSGAWWFLSAYLLVSLISPAVNQLLQNKSAKCHFLIILALLFIYAVGKMVGSAYFYVIRGLLFYYIGVFAFKFGKNKIGSKRIALFLLFALLYSISVAAGFISHNYLASSSESIYLLANRVLIAFDASIIATICSLTLFLLFNAFSFQSTFINSLSKSVFGIYLFHDSYISRWFVWFFVIDFESIYLSPFFPLLSVCIVIGVLVACFSLDFLRRFLFKKTVDVWIEKMFSKNDCVES